MVQRILARAGRLHPLARLPAGEELVGGEVVRARRLLPVGESGVEAVYLNPGSDCFLDRGNEGIRGDKAGRDAIDLGVDRVLMSNGLLEWRRDRPVLQCRASVLAACSAPALIRSEKVSPGDSWVIMAKV